MSTHPIVRLLGTDPKRVIGLMSGDALDGIDAALLEIEGHGADARVRLLRFTTLPFPPTLRDQIERLMDPAALSTAADLSTVNILLGNAFADAAAAVAGGERVDLVGSHGQTMWHQPPWMKSRSDLIASTLQLGEPAVIAARMDAVTVGDFRVADVAVGGEGAPLSPYADWVLCRKPGAVRAIQNVGAISAVTVVGERLSDVYAFDNGPGTLIIDALARRFSKGEESCDRDGSLSARGLVMPDVLARLLDDDYLSRPPPKSTGRERYGGAYVERLLTEYARDRVEDLLATVVAFAAEAIARSYKAFVLPRSPVAEVLVAGAGARNQSLMANLKFLLRPLPVRAFDEGGIPAEAKEAVAFALLAVEAVHGAPASVAAATGARRPAVLGKICLPPP